MDYSGWALFMDCDMLMKADISELWALRDDRYAVQVAKHDYVPKEKTKFLGQEQTIYPRKNWSSFMLMNCRKCTTLTSDFVNTSTGSQLHQFKWIDDDNLIGDIPLEWNWLVGEYDKKPDVKNLHYTKGGPYFKHYKDCDYAEDWFEEYNNMKKVDIE
jgi:lipopolysaccharide biosynthesis glycosyltransferase